MFRLLHSLKYELFLLVYSSCLFLFFLYIRGTFIYMFFCMFAKYTNLKDFMQGNDFTGTNPAFLEHLLDKLNEHIAKKGKVLLLTLTKKSSEEVTNFLVSK